MNGKLSPPSEVNEILKTEEYEQHVINVDQTTFVIYSRKSRGLGLHRMERNLPKIWRNFSELPRERVKVAWIVDLDAPMGGGPIVPYAVGLYFSKSISSKFQELLQKTTGWERLPSTQAYIDKYYSNFSDPTQAYVDDTLTHELGHLFFAFGLTSEPHSPLCDSWFSLGMGMVYDRIAWNKSNSDASPLFDGIIDLYRNKCAKLKQVDQRLINPDTAHDPEFGVSRAQIFSHGKSYVFLSALRNAVTPEIFDEAVNQYLSRPPGSEDGYEQFVAHLPTKTLSTRARVEKEIGIR